MTGPNVTLRRQHRLNRALEMANSCDDCRHLLRYFVSQSRRGHIRQGDARWLRKDHDAGHGQGQALLLELRGIAARRWLLEVAGAPPDLSGWRAIRGFCVLCGRGAWASVTDLEFHVSEDHNHGRVLADGEYHRWVDPAKPPPPRLRRAVYLENRKDDPSAQMVVA